MMMQAAVLCIELGAGKELLRRTSRRVEREIVLGEDFGEMGEVVLAGLSQKILAEVGKGCDGPAMVEGVPGIGQQEDEISLIAHDPPPFV